jgi:hypothetical protein
VAANSVSRTTILLRDWADFPSPPLLPDACDATLSQGDGTGWDGGLSSVLAPSIHYQWRVGRENRQSATGLSNNDTTGRRGDLSVSPPLPWPTKSLSAQDTRSSSSGLRDKKHSDVNARFNRQAGIGRSSGRSRSGRNCWHKRERSAAAPSCTEPLARPSPADRRRRISSPCSWSLLPLAGLVLLRPRLAGHLESRPRVPLGRTLAHGRFYLRSTIVGPVTARVGDLLARGDKGSLCVRESKACSLWHSGGMSSPSNGSTRSLYSSRPRTPPAGLSGTTKHSGTALEAGPEPLPGGPLSPRRTSLRLAR